MTFFYRLVLTLAMINAAFSSLGEEISLTWRELKKNFLVQSSLNWKVFAEKCLKTFKSAWMSLSLISLANDSVFHQHLPFYVQSLVSHFLSSCTLFTISLLWIKARNGRNHLRFYDLIDIKSGKYRKKRKTISFWGEESKWQIAFAELSDV